MLGYIFLLYTTIPKTVVGTYREPYRQNTRAIKSVATLLSLKEVLETANSGRPLGAAYGQYLRAEIS